MLKVLLGSQIGILSVITVVGAILVVTVWGIYWYVKMGKEKPE
jgi:hypothetical protein